MELLETIVLKHTNGRHIQGPDQGCTGRNRSEFFKREWREAVYKYFKEVKEIFDPLNLLNPGVMFSEKDFTEGLEF